MMSYQVKIFITFVILVIVTVFLNCQGTLQLSDSTNNVWIPYDGMAPAVSDQPDYFAAPFMPVFESPNNSAMPIAANGKAASIYYSAEDANVVEVAAEALRADIQRVTGLQPEISTGTPQASTAILIGTIGQSPLINQLIEAGKIDVSEVEGKWEAYTAEVVNNPLPGVEQGLIIAGSDRRGTAFGVFGLSESMGVSPWHFWGSAPVPMKPAHAHE